MKKILLALAVVVIVSGCVSSDNPDQNSNTESPPMPSDQQNGPDNTSPGSNSGSSNNTIFFTDSGFKPESLEVNTGETVTWIDNSERSMWIASDRHPSHRDYSGTSVQQHCGDSEEQSFDQCETGERYSFTFDKEGTWSYHNHQPFVQGGEIVVN